MNSEMDMIGFRTRIGSLIGDERPFAWAKRIGIPSATFARIWNEGAVPKADHLLAISQTENVSIDWLVYGDSSDRQGGVQGQQQNTTQTQLADIRDRVKAIESGVGSAAGLEPGFVMIPRYDVEASAGPGMFSDQENVVDYMAFQRKWVRQALRADPDHLVLITAAGDSMEPVIRSGDLLLVDTSIDYFRDDAIYVIAMAGNLVVKRIQRFFAGGVSVKSDNPAYVEQTIGAGDLNQVHVAGRVRWIGRLI